MQLKRISVFFTFFLTMYFFGLTHCDHTPNSANLDKNLQPINQIVNKPFQETGTLDITAAQPISVTFNYEKIVKSFPQEQEYISKLLKAAANFLSKLIKIKRLTTLNKYNETSYNSNKQKCFDKKIPSQDVTQGISNSDLHIYVSPSIHSPFASSFPCAQNYTQQPRFGVVFINMEMFCQYSRTRHLSPLNKFSQLRSDSIKNVSKNTQIKQIEINNKKTDFLTSPNVLKTARKYSYRSNLEGMPIENDDKLSGGHWEKTFTGDALQNPKPSVFSIKLSVFTISLLKDSGYFEDVNENLSFSITWGKSKGCAFIMNTTQGNFSEFNKPKELLGCSEQGNIESIISNLSYIDVPQHITQYQCSKSYSKISEQYKSKYLFDLSFDSKCFEGNLIHPENQKEQNQLNQIFEKLVTRCYQSKCQNNNSSIKITFTDYPKDSVVCSKDEAGLTKKVSLKGQNAGEIRCLKNYEQFCFSGFCKNNCSMSGLCFKGKCVCNEGFSSTDCSQPFPLLQYNKSVKGCSENKYANPDNVCRDKGPYSYFKKQGKCLPCDFSCSKCTGPSSSNCSACQFLTYLQGTTCVSQCKEGYYPNESSQKCEKK